MNARLDRKANYYSDYAGGVSDPRLVNRLQHIAPYAAPTPEQEQWAADFIASYVARNELSDRTHKTLHQMVLGREAA